MTWIQFLLFLTAQEFGVMANSTDGNVKQLLIKGPAFNLVNYNDPVTAAALQVILATARIAVLQAASSPIFTLDELLELMTAAERSAIVGSTDANVKTFLFQNVNSSFTMAQIKAGLDYLVSTSVITQARETAILGSAQPGLPTS